MPILTLPDSTTKTGSTAPSTVGSAITNLPILGKNGTLPLGWYAVGGLAAISLADTQIGPVIIAFLAAAVIYNAGQLLK